jgi:hypothetical protein
LLEYEEMSPPGCRVSADRFLIPKGPIYHSVGRSVSLCMPHYWACADQALYGR